MTCKEWKKCKIGDFINIKHGFAFKGDFISTEDNGKVVVTPGNFAIGGGFQEDKCKFYTGEFPQEYILNGNDLIVTMTDLSKDCDTLGYSAKVPYSKNRIYLHNQRIGLIEFKNTDINEDFLYWYMRTYKYQKTVVGSCSGSVIKHTSPNRICDIEIGVPPLETQQKIAKVLSAIDDKIDLNNSINKNLEQQAQAIFKSWFVDFEPFGGTMPDNWDCGTIEDLSKNIICGKTPSTAKKEYYGSAIPFITIPDMHNNTFVTKTERYLSEAGANSQSNKLLPPNSICVSCIATAGLVSMTAVDSQTNQQINSIIPKENISSYYIYLLIKSLSQKIIMLGSSGSTTCNLNKGQFAKIEATIPSKNILQKYDEIVKPLFENIKSNQQENEQLTQLRDTLLPKLMSGEIDVENVDISTDKLSDDSKDK